MGMRHLDLSRLRETEAPRRNAEQPQPARLMLEPQRTQASAEAGAAQALVAQADHPLRLNTKR